MKSFLAKAVINLIRRMWLQAQQSMIMENLSPTSKPMMKIADGACTVGLTKLLQPINKEEILILMKWYRRKM